ncbi:MAG TPA: cupin domain-containing protein [Steroidobacteraceae bacterium]|jgi:uncharacterized cupin superfamily protein|nr:cupin domain-containing protein [Steroidobacteraceae bacterium]
MPKIDIAAVPARKGTDYPPPFDAPCAARVRRPLGDVLEGELTLIEDGGETVLRAGDCAAFPKGTGNGHHLINRSSAMAVFLDVGSRHPLDLATYSDIDMRVATDGPYVHKDGTPYAES